MFRKIRLGHLIATFALFPSLAQADSVDLFDLSLKELLSIPITGSTFHEESRKTVPSAVTVFSRTQIEQLGVETLAELANLAPGFQVLRGGDTSAFSEISSRGRRISTQSAEILLLVDGKRVRDIRVSGLVSLMDFSLFSAERVEFIRGPGAALYGSGAMMGVINVVTRSDVREFEMHLGNNGNGQLSVGGFLDSSLGELDSLFSYRTSDGQHFTVPDSFTGAPVDTQDAYDTSNALLKYSKGDWSGSAQFARQVYEGFYALEVVDPDVSRFEQTFIDASLSYRRQSNYLTHRTGVNISQSASKTQARFTPPGVFIGRSSPPSGAASLAFSDFEGRELELTHHTDILLNAKNLLAIGFTVDRHEITGDRLYKNFLSIGDVNDDGMTDYLSSPNMDFEIKNYKITKQSYSGLYREWLLKADVNGEFTVGFRHDYYFDIDKQHFSPRLAWVYSLGDSHSIKLLYGEAFRAPNLHEIGVVDNGFIRSNEFLKPETVSTSELIWFGSSQHFFWSLGYFYSSFRNPILQEMVVGELSSGTRQYVNSNHDDISGIEAEMQMSFGSFLCTANSTHILNTDDIAFRESTELMNFTVNYSFGSWNLNLASSYRGDRGESINQQDSLSSYWLSTSKLRYKLVDGLDVIAQIHNLADDQVYYPSQGRILAKGIPSRGREYSLGFRWEM